MGGNSSSTTQQNSTTAPWQPSQGLLTGVLGDLNAYRAQTGITGAQTNAINTIEGNGANTNQYAPAIQNYTSNLLNGGGANAQAGNINSAYQTYQNQTSPLASNTNYDPMQTPGIGDQLAALKNNISSSVNGQFAAAGRDMSPANSTALSYGLSSGLAPILTGQYNQNVQNQQSAAGNLYSAGNTTSGLLTGLNQTALGNQGAGVSAVGAGQDALNSGSMNTLAAEAQRLGIPLQNLGMLANIGVPIAGLGSTSTGTGSTQNQMSGAQQFGLITSGLGSLIPKGPISFG